MINVKGPGKLSRTRNEKRPPDLSGKILLMTSLWSFSPGTTVDAGYQIPPQIEEMSGEKINLDHSSYELEREGSDIK